MKSSIERISSVECRVNVEIPWTEVSGRLSDKMRDLRRRARLPGFRPGKVPAAVLERQFGKGIRQELAGELVQETFESAMSEHDQQPLTQPIVEDSSLEKEAPFTYAARFEVRPEIEPKDYTGVAVRRRPAVSTDAQIEAELERRQKDLTELRPLPDDLDREETAEGDVWTVDVEGTLGQQRVSRKDVRVDIGESDEEFVPGLSEALASLKLSEVGSIKNVTFTPTAEKIRPELRGQEAALELGLREVKVKHVPEIDDEFAKDCDAENLEELKAKIKADLEEADGSEAEGEAQRRLIETLLESNPFEPAPSMISNEVNARIQQMKRQLAMQNMNFSHLGTTEQRYASQLRPEATFNVKATLLIDAVGKKEEIDISDEDLGKALEERAESNGQNVDRMRASMEKSGELAFMRAQLRQEKILEFLMEKADVTEAPDPEPEEGDPGHGHEGHVHDENCDHDH